ncbi:thiamine pyrophosphate-binding protein [bacterium]|nr:thiamine pyrophosphate-binding protein [bacterium]
MINKEECLKVLAKYRTDEIVITTMSVPILWGKISDHELDYASINTAMGHAADFALGIALARPDKKIIVLNGDGSMLMSLGTLVTITNTSVKNLLIFVMENDTYEVTGNQPIPGAGKISFATMARGAGFQCVYDFEQLSEFEQNLPKILQEEGPIFVTLRLEKANEPVSVRRPDNPVKYLSKTLAEETQRLKAVLAKQCT